MFLEGTAARNKELIDRYIRHKRWAGAPKGEPRNQHRSTWVIPTNFDRLYARQRAEAAIAERTRIAQLRRLVRHQQREGRHQRRSSAASGAAEVSAEEMTDSRAQLQPASALLMSDDAYTLQKVLEQDGT